MSANSSSLRIDWFDGSLVPELQSTYIVETTALIDEELRKQELRRTQIGEKETIGFKRLLDLSFLRPPSLTLELLYKPGFWNLLDVEVKEDYIVLMVKILANVYPTLEPGETSTITRLLQTRFRNSKFWLDLKAYINNLPNVKTVDKKTNCRLWDDIESFYFNVLSICEGIINYEIPDTRHQKDLLDFLTVTKQSATGVMIRHTETFSQELFLKFEEMIEKMNEIMENYEELVKQGFMNRRGKVNNFKHLNIFPTTADLLGSKEVVVEPNIVDGAYSSVAHYLDVQFKLLREDCFGPLREGISQYLQNPEKKKYDNIRVYTQVRFLRTRVSNNKVGHLVDLAWQDRGKDAPLNVKKFTSGKQLMFGSLLLFTKNNFKNVLCATVLDSNVDLLKEGYLIVSFEDIVSNNIYSGTYLMVESEIFFEPYHRVLKVIQNSRLDDIPMKRYIVEVQKKTYAPSYLTNDTMYSVIDTNNKEVYFNVLGAEHWPVYYDFDSSQYEAYRFALTHEFAVIQGPPGTGKTNVGVKIASTLLKNLSLEGTPILVICQTNHALDQFLEGLLDTTKNIIRLGTQSKSSKLEPYSLHNARMKGPSKYGHLYAAKRSELEGTFNYITKMQAQIDKCDNEVVCFKHLKAYLKFNEKMMELVCNKEDAILTWLFDDDQEFIKSKKIKEDWERFLEYMSIHDDVIDTCFSEKQALKDIESMKKSINNVQHVTEKDKKKEEMIDEINQQIAKIENRRSAFEKFKTLYHRAATEYIDVKKIKDLYTVPLEQRWILYYKAVDKFKDEFSSSIHQSIERYNQLNEELNELTTATDSEVMKTARVVGVTTTTAARRHDLMKKLQSPIVIVEEASEVMEAHILASLTQHCKHLILIGDYKQLRPSAAHYKLARHYKLEISLFERMVRNKVHSRSLMTQRRMRPEFAGLLVPTLYEKLENHPQVERYPRVRGMAHNLFFYTHGVFEDSASDEGWSQKNSFEAKWCVALANYLIKMEYKPADVTILATYNGQVTLLKELSKKYATLRDIKITAVDNFQGEESKIVILSLVRSNAEGNIGFVSAANRICVALSRAKEGLYIFGNMNAMITGSAIWRAINNKLVDMKAIGNKIKIHCKSHVDNVMEIENSADFDYCFSGTCLKSCYRT